jgi:hypothetical protein
MLRASQNYPHEIVTKSVTILQCLRCALWEDGCLVNKWTGKSVEESGCDLICPNLRYCPSICLKVFKETTKDFSQDSRSEDRELNWGPPEYESGVLNT